ncbi:MAG: type 4a pilus biogenesis protein PilO [Pirellulales bacterium]|nr:type 4a pilus biogenesis protein PilO [Pirellulales bacterium]
MPHRDPNRRLGTLSRWMHGLGLLIALGIAGFVEFAVYRPIDGRTATCLKRNRELQALLREAPRVRADHARLTQEVADARAQAAVLKSRIPDEPQEADFLAQVSQLAGEVGLDIQDYCPGVITSRQTYSTMQVELICEGDYYSICNFLYRLAELPRHSTVVGLEINSEKGGQRYSAKMSLELYFAATGRPADIPKEVRDA